MTEDKTPATVQPWRIDIVIVLLMILIAVITTHTWNSYQSTAQARWEYIVVAVKDESFKEDMYTLGDSGWELVSARRASVGEIDFTAAGAYKRKPEFAYEMIFRRPANRDKPLTPIKGP